MAAAIASGALRCGQCPMLSIRRSSLFCSLCCMYAPTATGAITSSEFCRISVRVFNQEAMSGKERIRVDGKVSTLEAFKHYEDHKVEFPHAFSTDAQAIRFV